MKRHQQAGIKLRNRTKLGMDLCDTDSNQGIIATHRMCVCVHSGRRLLSPGQSGSERNERHILHREGPGKVPYGQVDRSPM